MPSHSGIGLAFGTSLESDDILWQLLRISTIDKMDIDNIYLTSITHTCLAR